jgi:hypothetical protein
LFGRHHAALPRKHFKIVTGIMQSLDEAGNAIEVQDLEVRVQIAQREMMSLYQGTAGSGEEQPFRLPQRCRL